MATSTVVFDLDGRTETLDFKTATSRLYSLQIQGYQYAKVSMGGLTKYYVFSEEP